MKNETIRGIRLGGALLVLVASASLGSAEIIERIVAKVNGEIITKTELDRAVQAALEPLGPAPSAEEEARREEEARKSVLNAMVDKLLVLQKAQEKGLRIPPRYFDEWKSRTMKELKIETEDEFLRQVKDQGMNVDDLKKQFEESVLVSEIRRMEVDNKVSVNEPDIAKYYREHVEKYTEAPKVRLREIVFLVGDAGEAEARARAERVLADIRQGADFADMARLHSDSASKESGGDLGFFKKGELDAPLEKVATSLAPGDISGVIPREKAFYLIKLDERTEEKTSPLDEVRSQIAEDLFQERVKAESEKYMKKLRAESIIEFPN